MCLLSGDQLLSGGLQLFLVPGYGLLLQAQLFIQHDQLGRQRTGIGVYLFDSRRSQTEPALGKLHLFTQ